MNTPTQGSALSDVYEGVRPAIVAFASRAAPQEQRPPLFPPIIGTGFFVDERGIAVTNRHVIDVLQKLPEHPITKQKAAFALVFTKVVNLEKEKKYRIRILHVNIRDYRRLGAFSMSGRNYGEALPDFAFVTLKIRNVPTIPLAKVPFLLKPGLEIATAGFPLGNKPIQAYGGLNQLTPTLRRGIVSSVLPYHTDFPHGFTIDIMSQGGASGSPIFLLNEALAVGILHGGFEGTNFTYAVPSQIVLDGLVGAYQSGLDMTQVPTLDEQIALADCEPEGGAGLQWEPAG